MAYPDFVDAQMHAADGSKSKLRVPLPLPQAAVFNIPVHGDGTWAPGETPQTLRYTHRLFVMLSGPPDRVEYQEDTAGPDIARGVRSYIPLRCQECSRLFKHLLSKAIPLQLPFRIESVGWLCDSCYRKRHGPRPSPDGPTG
jgi:hypothetical protein